MDRWELIVGIVTFAVGFWAQVRGFLGWLGGLLVVTKATESELGRMVLAYLMLTGRRSARTPAYGMDRYFIRSLGDRRQVIYESLVDGGSQVVWWRRRPVFVKRTREDKGETFDVHFSFVRGTVDWDALLLAAQDWSDGQGESSTRVRYQVHFHFGESLVGAMARREGNGPAEAERWVSGWTAADGNRPLRWRNEDIGGLEDGMGDAFVLPPEIEAVAEEVRLWHRSKGWYLRRRLPWRRGYMFHGLPGTGKTSLARELAHELNIPVHVMDLASMGNEDLQTAWKEAADDAPCMVLIEDIDGVFRGRENVSGSGLSGGGLSFDRLLNCVDGIERVNGILLVVTTNAVDGVDPALMRAGRVDRSVEFPLFDHSCRLRLAQAVVGDSEQARELARSVDDLPVSKFMEMCTRVAMEQHFKDQQHS